MKCYAREQGFVGDIGRKQKYGEVGDENKLHTFKIKKSKAHCQVGVLRPMVHGTSLNGDRERIRKKRGKA